MIYIYCEASNTVRLSYVANHLLGRILGIEFVLTHDESFFLNQPNASCINYSAQALNHGIWINPQGLLSETGIKEIKELNTGSWRNGFCFFRQEQGDIPFDILAASFYLLTLYEELFSDCHDQHGRFPHTNSLLFLNNALETPLIDRWAYSLKEELLQRGYDEAGFRLKTFRYLNTYDIDHPYLYRNKGLVRTLGGAARDFIQLNWGKVIDRLSVNIKLKEDPYFEALRFIEKIQSEHKREYCLFILLGQNTKYDRYIHFYPGHYYEYLRRLKHVELGLHPSYNTFRNLDLLTEEKKELERILRRSVSSSRQHFLRMQSPETFEELILAGIKEDYTLAFAEASGFRSGTSVPYPFYDLNKEKETRLILHPTAFMDSNLIFHQALSPEAGLEKIKSLINECRNYGGDFIALWHNSNLTEKENNRWRNVLIEATKYGISLENN